LSGEALTVTAGGDVAFSHALHRYSGVIGGKQIAMWLRATTCYRKLDGTWRIAHEHQSVPFDPETGVASLDLQP
jgi:ketosteroid isomerase-like protein